MAAAGDHLILLPDWKLHKYLLLEFLLVLVITTPEKYNKKTNGIWPRDCTRKKKHATSKWRVSQPKELRFKTGLLKKKNSVII